jgi:hypothetical protein
LKENKMNTQTNDILNTAAELVNGYIAIWNERDDTRRRTLIAQTWTDDTRYLDPLMRGEGHAGIDAMIQAVQERFVGHHFRQLGTVDAHNNTMRFSWELAAEGGAVLACGTDFAEISADGRLQTVTGFLDPVPATAAELA